MAESESFDAPAPAPQASETVRIFDTTLRDGEQSPGASLNKSEKIEIAKALQDLGVDIIEAGFPIASPDDFDAVQAIANQIDRATVCGLARCTYVDIERAVNAVAPARKPRVHVFCATSAIHREFKLKKAKEEIVRMSAEGVATAVRLLQQAGHQNPDVEFSPEDASRTEPEFLVQVCRAAIDQGATTLNIPDTVGYAMPAEYGALFAYLADHLPEVKRAEVLLSAHCHDDLGLAVANSLEAVRNGARQIECTINGIGERAGNASLEELVMALRTRSDFWGLGTRIQNTRLYPTSRLVSTMTGLQVQRNKAIVGENAFAHESGIHQHGMLSHRKTYEIIDPAEVGKPATQLVLGKHSGRHAFRDRLSTLGYYLEEAVVDAAFDKFKRLADRKKEIYDDDIVALVEDVMEAVPETWSLVYVQTIAGGETMPTATVRLVRHNDAGDDEQFTEASTGDGPIDACFTAILRMVKIECRLTDYQIRAVTGGREAQGQVSLEITLPDGTRSRGLAASTDIIEASARAYLLAINRVVSGMAARRRQHPQHDGNV